MGLGAGMKVERRANPEQDWRIQAIAEFSHPIFLLRSAQADPHEIRSRGVDRGHNLSILRLCGRAKRRRPNAANSKIWKLFVQSLRKSVRDAGRAAKEEVAITPGAGTFACGDQQIRAVDP